MNSNNVLEVAAHLLQLDGQLRGEEFWFSCPSPNHADRRPSCSVNTETGLWCCLGCGAGGDLTSLVALVRGTDRGTAARLVEPHTPEGMLATLKRHINVFSTRAKKQVAAELPSYPPSPLTYLYGRGFSREICERYGAGYVAQEKFERKDRTYTIRDFVALPVRDRAGHLMAYCYRNTANANPRYLYTPDVSLAQLWFGAHLYPSEQTVVVTEGALDSMWVAQAGLAAWGLLGANMVSDAKLAQLRRHGQVVLFMDRDAAGVRATQQLGEKVQQWVPTLVARYPAACAAKDPAELKPEEVRRCVKRAIPFQVWSARSFEKKVS